MSIQQIIFHWQEKEMLTVQSCSNERIVSCILQSPWLLQMLLMWWVVVYVMIGPMCINNKFYNNETTSYKNRREEKWLMPSPRNEPKNSQDFFSKFSWPSWLRVCCLPVFTAACLASLDLLCFMSACSNAVYSTNHDFIIIVRCFETITTDHHIDTIDEANVLYSIDFRLCCCAVYLPTTYKRHLFPLLLEYEVQNSSTVLQ